MAKHMVKCPYCNEIFDSNSEPFVKVGRRYAHEKCYNERDIEAEANKITGKHVVVCKYCGQSFDRDTEPCVKIGNRYAHKTCFENQDKTIVQEDLDREAFWEYIKVLYGKKYNYPSINKQVETYIKEYNFTYSGMLKALKWFYEIERGDKEDSGGRVGILPYIYEDARRYYFNIYLAQNRMREAEFFKQVEAITITSPTTHARPVKLWFSEDED